MDNNPILYKKVPFTKERFFQVYVHETKEQERHVLLESGRTGRYSIAGITPFAVFQASGNEITIEQSGKRTMISGKALLELEKWMKPFSFTPIPGLPDFQGGAIGYISYDYTWSIERLPNMADDDLQFPHIYFLVFDEWVVFDHEEECLWIMVLNRGDAKEKLLSANKRWLTESIENTEITTTPSKLKSVHQVSFTEEEFVTAVEKVQAYIEEGDVFQVNLTVRQSKELEIPPFDIYKELRILNPSPYMGYFHTPEFQIVSGSPELLIKKSGDIVSTRPIAGTRSRGMDDEDDQRLANELMENKKEQAEHIMLVDLERNDIGKVCAYGSVKVDELMTVEKYSHVMHIVSHVSGQLAEEKSAYDLIEATFPGGTITGAPKVRTLEIIEELESVKRGVYTGSLGWIGFNEDLHLNIVIRTMLIKDGMCHVQAGAGIVIDSDPKAEYEESLKKARALWKAKEVAESKVENA
ncbi:anthranilate synthase component I family protein [Bacillus sp. FSL K6-3431]|uniref:anthranilate synthase component I family protein n=1 Tax=Bacillus sp. FSL K6-3431 TaxID=2921500 RepID=UPI0030F5F20F